MKGFADGGEVGPLHAWRSSQISIKWHNVSAVWGAKNQVFIRLLTTMYMNAPVIFRKVCRLENSNCICR